MNASAVRGEPAAAGAALFSRILVGVDRSASGDDAVRLSARLAREHGGEVVLAHAVNWLPVVAQVESGTHGVVLDPNPVIETLKTTGAALLAHAAAAAAAAGVAARRQALEGEPASALLAFAAEAHASLIVMAMHGRRGMSRFFLGSTTEAVLRASSILVLTIRPGTAIPPESRRCFERIIVGIDDSDPSDAAVESVLAFPPEDRQALVFVSVADVDAIVGGRGLYYGPIRETLRAQCERVVDAAVAAAHARGAAARGRVAAGACRPELLAAAEREGADLLVLGSHGRRGIQRFWLGSVAENIVRASPIPVLVVRTPALQRCAGTAV